MKHSLKQAIKLHQKHMDEPATATMKSQKQMMTQMKRHQAEMKAKKKRK